MNNTETAIFAAGCFWGVQYYFDQMPGVLRSEVGYTGGHKPNPSYEEVCAHMTGHAEAVKLEFNPAEAPFETLLRHFFRLHDPTQLNRQGPDVGDNYRSAIFYTNEEQKEVAEKVLSKLNEAEYGGRIVTEITKAGEWWPAEAYHQKFTERTGRGMCHVQYQPL